MNTFGEKIRKLRQERNLPLRIVAAFLKIDQAILSKIERGQRKASRELVVKFSSYFDIDQNELLTAWMSDQLVSHVKDEDIAFDALKVAEQDVLYHTRILVDRDLIIRKLADFLKHDGRVKKAWIFGSFARGEYRTGSDIDLMISYSEKASGTLFDYADIKQKIECLLNCRIDLVEEGFVKSFALKSVNRDKVLIYG